MAVAIAPKSDEIIEPLTYENYLDEGFVAGSYTIEEGIRYFMPGPTWKHQRIVKRLLRLMEILEENGKGYLLPAPFDIVIRRAPLRTRQPDVFFISRERMDAAGGPPAEGPLEVGPELIIEVLSPSESPRTLQEKLLDFAAVGTREAWIVSPEAETVQVQRLSADEIETIALYGYGQIAVSEAVPELHLDLADIFG